MNLEKLEADLKQLQEKYLQGMGAIRRLEEETQGFVGINGYTEKDSEHELKAFIQDLLAKHDPRLAMRPIINEAVAIYELVSSEERAAIRNAFGKFFHASGQLLGYIVECAECLETPEDANIFRLGLIAASIENYAFDFRDTDMILAELAIAATNANIDIEPHCTSIAELCSDEWGKGGGFMKRKLAQFHIYAPSAVRLVPYDWVNGVNLPELVGTPQHQQILHTIVEHYTHDDRILAVLVFGSLGRGNWDKYSDLDLDIVTHDGISIDLNAELARLCDVIKHRNGLDALIIPNNAEEGDVVLSNLVEFSIRYHPLSDTKPAILDSMVLLTGNISLEQIQIAGEANRIIQQPNLNKMVNQCIRYTLELQNSILRQRFWMSLELLHYIRLLLMELFTITHQGIRPVQFFEANANPDLQERLKRILPHRDLESVKVAFGEVIHLLEHDIELFTNGHYQLTEQQHEILLHLKQPR